ncbi:hypothetical protein ACHAXR_009197 [Thalassiosira sp. AJA248-18]
MSHSIFQLIISIGIFAAVCAFAPPAATFSQRSIAKAKVDVSMVTQDAQALILYPVLSRIASTNWTGSCKYVGADLIHLSKLKLTGGIRYDIEGRNITLSSYLTFPNGKTREVVMTGSREVDSPSPVITLKSIEGAGPIRMLLTEVGSDTLLVNEVEEATGEIILTSSTSITQGMKGMELVQVSHEVGKGIEGHQVWRLTEAPYVASMDADAARDVISAQKKKELAEASDTDLIEFNDFEGYIDTTGR